MITIIALKNRVRAYHMFQLSDGTTTYAKQIIAKTQLRQSVQEKTVLNVLKRIVSSNQTLL